MSHYIFKTYVRHFLVFIILFYVLLASFSYGDEVSNEEDPIEDIIVGGETVENPNNVVYTELAQEAMNKYLEEIGFNRHHEIQVVRVTTQVVAGTLTRIYFYAFSTTCPLMQGVETNNPPCVISHPPHIFVCSAEILEQSWLNEKNIEVLCKPKP